MGPGAAAPAGTANKAISPTNLLESLGMRAKPAAGATLGVFGGAGPPPPTGGAKAEVNFFNAALRYPKFLFLDICSSLLIERMIRCLI